MTLEWSKFLQSKEKQEPFTHKPMLDAGIRGYILPVFESLSSDLQKRCLGRKTQNSNECYNNSFWSISPKSKLSGKNVTEIASWITVSTFNESSNTYLAIMDLIGVKIDKIATACAISYSYWLASRRTKFRRKKQCTCSIY